MKIMVIYLIEFLVTVSLIGYMAASFVVGIDRYAAQRDVQLEAVIGERPYHSPTEVATASRPAVQAASRSAAKPPPSPTLLDDNTHERPGTTTGEKTVSGLAFHDSNQLQQRY